MRSRHLLPALLLALLPALAACGSDEDDGPDSSSTTSADSSASDESSTAPASDATSAATPTTTEGVPSIPSACETLTPADLEAAYGVAFGPAEPGGGGHSEGDNEWQSDNCSWEAVALLEVQLELTGADDLSGAFTCPEPTEIASKVTPVDGLGDQAWWEVDDATPLRARLRVCTPDYNFDIALDYEDGVDFVGDPQTQSIALAGVVLAKLG